MWRVSGIVVLVLKLELVVSVGEELIYYVWRVKSYLLSHSRFV